MKIFRNYIAPSFIFLILEKIYGYIFYMKIFQSSWVNLDSLFRPMNDPRWTIGMTILPLLFGLTISIFYVKISERLKNDLSIFCFALKIFLITRLFGELYNYMMFSYTLDLMLVGLIHGLCVILSWAFLTKTIFIINK